MGSRLWPQVIIAVAATALLAYPAMAEQAHTEPAGPTGEARHHGGDDHHFKADTAATDEDETYYVMRFGAAYYFHVGSRYGIGPAVNLDLVDGHEVWIYGVNFEVMF